MRKIFLIVFTTIILFNRFAYSEVIPKTYEATRTSEQIKIDGEINEAAWATAKVAGDFIQFEPVEGSKVTQQTEVRVLYDNTAIYVFASMYDTNADSILHELGNRDEGYDLNADGFRFAIDPYNKRQSGYVFSVTASGVQTEILDDDFTFDAVWESDVKITDKGWFVEMKIPYSAIRFPSADVQTWGLQFARSIRRNREYDQWTLTPKEVQNRLLFWGTMTGISDIKPPVRLNLIPYFSVYVDRAPRYENGVQNGYDNSFGYSGGADLKYGIDERFTLDMTLLPDFSQVQSDNKVKNLSAFETIYDENRPFFKEGTSLFSKGNLFYSRRIGSTPELFYDAPYLLEDGEVLEKNPDKAKLVNATKLSGRTDNGLGIGLLNAITANTYAKIKTVDGGTRKLLTEPLTNYNILVFDQQLKHNCSVTFINTNVTRDAKARDANVTNLQGAYQNKKNTYQIFGSGSFSHVTTWDENKHTKDGALYYFSADKIKGTSQFGASIEIANANYDKNDLGYNFYRDYTSIYTYWTFQAFNPFWKYFKQGNITPFISRSGRLSDNNRLTDLTAGFNFFLLFNNNWSIYTEFGTSLEKGIDFYEPRLDGRYNIIPNNDYGSINFTTNYNKRLAFDFGGRYNIIHEWKYNAYGYYLNPIIRVSDKMSVKMAHYLDVYNNNRGFINYDDVNDSIYYGSRNIITIVNSITSRYLFKNDMSLSLTGRHYWSKGIYHDYYKLTNNGELISVPYAGALSDFNFNSSYFTIDLVYNWQFAPGSSFLVTFKNLVFIDDNDINRDYFSNFDRTLSAPQTNSVSLKFLYYLDYQYLTKKRA